MKHKSKRDTTTWAGEDEDKEEKDREEDKVGRTE